MRTSNHVGFAFCTVLALGGCGSDRATGKDSDGGPSSSAGGTRGSSGGASAGGAPAGGASNSGGVKSSGGSANAGGATNSGGANDGGTTNSGGASGSGGSKDTGGSANTGAGGAATDAGSDASAADVCGSALFCEKFDGYAGVGALADKQKLGPWHASLTSGATMALDGKHKTSGASALHVHIDETVTAGGRLFSDGAQPIFASKPTHVYGRMMMYIDPNGTSVHWTFFGVNGDAEPSSPATGRNASYILSSLPKNGVNTYSFVYGLAAMGSDGYHDCSSQSTTSMPSAWACVSFETDSVARTLRVYKDGATTPILSVDDHGKGCVAPTAVDSPWYGPAITQLYAGAWSFHAMDAPLDVWIDDLVVDTKPVACPSQ